MRSFKIPLMSAETLPENTTSLESDGGLEDAEGAGAEGAVGMTETVYEELADDLDTSIETPEDVAEDTVLSWLCGTGLIAELLFKRATTPMRMAIVTTIPKIFDCGIPPLYASRARIQ